MDSFTCTVAFDLNLEIECGFTTKDIFGKENRVSQGMGHEKAGDLS